MAADREQRDKLMELMGEGSTRRIRLTVMAVLALSGIVLQGLVYWYAAQTASSWSVSRASSGTVWHVRDNRT